jgi:cobalt/nickel transport system permease protein
MHMADALLSPAVGGVMCAASAAAIAYSAAKVKKDELSEKKLPIMAVTGAFVFAAQMINFTIPGTGSSGHIGGGILLCAMLGGYPALLSLAAVLIIQCLFFADGGLLALGCNIFNIGVIPCLLVYPLIFKPIVKKGLNYKRITIATIISVVVGLQLGAFGVVLETLASGITELPFSTFVVLMQPIHLAIGLVEGIVMSAILCFVYKMRPEILESSVSGASIERGVPVKKVVAAWRL